MSSTQSASSINHSNCFWVRSCRYQLVIQGQYRRNLLLGFEARRFVAFSFASSGLEAAAYLSRQSSSATSSSLTFKFSHASPNAVATVHNYLESAAALRSHASVSVMHLLANGCLAATGHCEFVSVLVSAAVVTAGFRATSLENRGERKNYPALVGLCG